MKLSRPYLISVRNRHISQCTPIRFFCDMHVQYASRITLSWILLMFKCQSLTILSTDIWKIKSCMQIYAFCKIALIFIFKILIYQGPIYEVYTCSSLDIYYVYNKYSHVPYVTWILKSASYVYMYMYYMYLLKPCKLLITC